MFIPTVPRVVVTRLCHWDMLVRFPFKGETGQLEEASCCLQNPLKHQDQGHTLRAT